MKIISISGLDGSGKSTQIELLKKNLESQGKKVLYFHAIQFSFVQKLKEFKNRYCLLCKFTKKSEQALTEEKSVTKANWIQIQLRKFFLLVDVFRFKWISKRYYSQVYDYVLSDRYFFDSVINIQYLSKNNRNVFASKFIPRPDKAFYLEVEPAMIMQRKRVPDQGLEYLRSKRDLFEKNIADWNIEKIDGNRTEEEISQEIKNSLSSL